jgi:CCR4-NOT transcriptional complex subunit CAF120
MVQTYQPHVMDVNEDTIPELLPIFTFLNSHQNKLYQEGYFLKLDDQDSSTGPPSPQAGFGVGFHVLTLFQEEDQT